MKLVRARERAPIAPDLVIQFLFLSHTLASLFNSIHVGRHDRAYTWNHTDNRGKDYNNNNKDDVNHVERVERVRFPQFRLSTHLYSRSQSIFLSDSCVVVVIVLYIVYTLVHWDVWWEAGRTCNQLWTARASERRMQTITHTIGLKLQLPLPLPPLLQNSLRTQPREREKERGNG